MDLKNPIHTLAVKIIDLSKGIKTCQRWIDNRCFLNFVKIIDLSKGIKTLIKFKTIDLTKSSVKIIDLSKGIKTIPPKSLNQ